MAGKKFHYVEFVAEVMTVRAVMARGLRTGTENASQTRKGMP
jgi:hypothetical protein